MAKLSAKKPVKKAKAVVKIEEDVITYIKPKGADVINTPGIVG